MINKENYVTWSSRLLRYAKSRPNGKLIRNSIINGPYVRRMIPEPGDINWDVHVNETFHIQTDDELTKNELKQIEADDQAIQTILLSLLEDIYAAVDREEGQVVQRMGKTKDLHTADYTQLYDFLKYNQKEVDELKAERLAKIQDPLTLMANSNNPSFNKNYMQQPMPNPKDITDPTTAMNMTLALMAKAFKLNYSTPTNNNQRISSNLRNSQIAQPGMNMGQDIQMQMVGGYGENQFRLYAGQNVGNLNGYNAVQNVRNQVAHNPRIQNVRNQNEQIGVPGNANLNGNGIQLQAEKFDLMAAAADLDEIEKVNANCILMANLQQASTSGTQTEKALVYDSDGSAEVRDYQNYNDNEIFNMFTQEEQYIELLEPIPEPHQVPQNDNDVISEEAAKFVGDFKSLAKEANASLAKHKALELEIERLLRAVVKRFENCIIKKENEYVKLWNDWYKKCDECKYEKISYDNAYKDMQQKIKWLQAQLGDLKGKSKDTSCVSDTLNPLSQKLENENVELEFQVLNYARENALLKAIYNNLFDFISVSRTQTKTIIDSLQKQLHNSIYENAKLIAQLFNKISDQKDNKHGTSTNTKFAKQSIMENLPMLDEIHALSKPVTSNSVPTPQESRVVKNDKVIAPGMFRINPFKTSREEKNVPNSVRASARTKPITVSQPPVFTKKDVNSDSNGLSSTRLDNTKTRRPHPRSNTKNDRVPSASKSSQSKNKEADVEEHHRNLLFSKNHKYMSSACNNFKLDSQNVISKVVYAMCKQLLIFVNQDICLRNYVNGKTSRGKKQKANVSIKEKQKKHQPKVKKPKKVGFIEIFATPKPSKPRFLLRWSPTGRLFNQKGKIIDSIESESQSDCSNGDNACTSNTLEHKIKRFPNSTSLLGSKSWLWHQHLSHLNFDTINDLTRNDLVSGLPKFKYHKEHLCPFCEQGKSKRSSHPPKPVPNSRQRLHLLHMDLCGPMRIASINRKRNRTLVEAARTMLIFSRTTLFLRTEAIATACFTQNRSIIHLRFNKTPYELINGRKPDISFLHVFGALCYPKNDHEDIGKLGAKGDIGFFIGYSADSCAYRVYNCRTKKIIETMSVSFDELLAMDFEQCSLKPGLQSMTSGQISSGLDLTYAPSTITTQQPSEGELDLLFEAIYDDYIGGQPSATARTILATKDHPLEQVIGEPSRPVLTRNQLRSDGDICIYALTLSTMEQKNVKEAMTDPAWIESMQKELLQFKRLDVWVLVPTPDNISPLTLKWLLKTSMMKNKKSRLVVRGYRQEEGIDFKKSFAPQAPKAWYDESSTFLLQNQFLKGTIDPTLFIRRFHDDILVVQVYVDDIIFGSTHPRPDIVHATCLCARYQATPTEKHLKEVKRIVCYLRGTINTGLWYTKDSGFELTGFSDANYAGCKDTFKSTSSRAQFLGEKLLTDYGFHFNKIPIYYDSKSTIAISCNLVQHSRTKHIAVRYHFIKEHVEKGTIELYFVKTDYELADLFTKALPANRFNYLVRRLGMRSLSP
nr:hypothetical protein [Tanacetum cinerariifolium]